MRKINLSQNYAFFKRFLTLELFLNTILIARYYFTNTGNDTLNIKKVSPDCICTGYHLSKNNILPRDTAYIELVFNTEHKYGEEKVYAIVEANTNVKMYKGKCLLIQFVIG